MVSTPFSVDSGVCVSVAERDTFCAPYLCLCRYGAWAGSARWCADAAMLARFAQLSVLQMPGGFRASSRTLFRVARGLHSCTDSPSCCLKRPFHQTEMPAHCSEPYVPASDHGLVLESCRVLATRDQPCCRVLASRDQAAARCCVSQSGFVLREMSGRSLPDQRQSQLAYLRPGVCSRRGSENTSSSNFCRDKSVRVRQHAARAHLQAWIFDAARRHSNLCVSPVYLQLSGVFDQRADRMNDYCHRHVCVSFAFGAVV